MLRNTRTTALLWITLLLVVGCGRAVEDSTWQTQGAPVEAGSSKGLSTITLGDIDPHTPTSRMLKIRPLADIIARDLGWDTSRVKIRIAQSIDQMALMLTDGEVDVYLDSVYPTLLVRKQTGSRIVLQSEVNGQATYHSLLITPAINGVNSIADLTNQTLAFQERYSTSGYLVPAAYLLDAGLKLQYTAGPGRKPATGRTGYFFSGDEENTLALLRKGMVIAGAIASSDFESLHQDVKDEFNVLVKSRDVPRKLISIRQDFNVELQRRLIDLLIALDDSDRDAMMMANGWNWNFEVLDDHSQSGVAATELMLSQLEAVLPGE